MLKILAASLCLAAAFAGQAATLKYDVEELPAKLLLGDENLIFGRAIDAKGRVLISVELANYQAANGQLCHKGKCSPVEVEAGWAVWNAFNASGSYAGVVKEGGGSPSPARLNSDGELEVLDEYGGASGINAAGVVVGGDIEPFYFDTVLHSLPHLGGVCGMARAINDGGLVAGSSCLENGQFRAVRWDLHGGITDLGVLNGGTSSGAFAINASGVIVGCSDSTKPRSVPVKFVGGKVKPLGTLAKGLGGCAFGINKGGVIVGNALVAKNAPSHAFVHEGGEMADLNELISAEARSRWLLTSAVAINDKGQIVVNAQRIAHKAMVVLLLTPR